MVAGIILGGLIVAGLLIFIIYLIHEMPRKLDQQMRALLVDYKKWAGSDIRHSQRLKLIKDRQEELVSSDERSLEYLRLERAQIKVELDQVTGLNAFLNTPESVAVQQKSFQLEEVENEIDEHPDRERELEETRTRLVARMEDIKSQEPDDDEQQ